MKKVLFSTIAAAGFVASGSAFAEQASEDPFFSTLAVDNVSIASTFDGFSIAPSTPAVINNAADIEALLNAVGENN